MNVNVSKLTKQESVLYVDAGKEIKTLTINKTDYGHSYTDFADWDISDEEYADLEDLVDNIMDKMKGYSTLNVSWND